LITFLLNIRKMP